MMGTFHDQRICIVGVGDAAEHSLRRALQELIAEQMIHSTELHIPVEHCAEINKSARRDIIILIGDSMSGFSSTQRLTDHEDQVILFREQCRKIEEELLCTQVDFIKASILLREDAAENKTCGYYSVRPPHANHHCVTNRLGLIKTVRARSHL